MGNSFFTRFSVVAVCSVLGACGAVPQRDYVELELSAIPSNPAATRMGPFKTLLKTRGRGDAELVFSVAGQNFAGQMQAIDESTRTSGSSSSTQRTGSLITQIGSRQASVSSGGNSKGIGTAASDKGVTMNCDFTVNNQMWTATGTFNMSNGAQYQTFIKPIRTVLTDGTGKPF